MELRVAPHPLLDARAFVTAFPAPLGTLADEMREAEIFGSWWAESRPATIATSDEVRKRVRDLLRHGKFKPTGRSKPASEYLVKAVEAGRLRAINLAVDACNLVSFHCGLPISVVDLAKAEAPFRIERERQNSKYEFNPSGQSIDLSDLLCLFDRNGPCANAVKDSQRTKTDNETTQTLSILWGASQLPNHSDAAEQWYRSLLEGCGCRTESVALRKLASSPNNRV